MNKKVYDMQYVGNVFKNIYTNPYLYNLRSALHFEDYFSFRYKKGSNVLDFGCGLGQNTIGIENRYGYDINKSLYPGLKERGFIMFDTEKDIPENFFDEILISQVLEHLDNPMETLNMLHTKLKKGGKIRIAVPNLVYDKTVYKSLNWDYDCGHLQGWSFRELNHRLNRCGFHVIHNKIIYRRGEEFFSPIAKWNFNFYRWLTVQTGQICGNFDVFVVAEKL